jgi:alpha-1,3-rhamnosyl/mannosyltransferase
MKIGVDIATARPGMTGVGRYATELARALAGAPDLELYLLHPDPAEARGGLGPEASGRLWHREAPARSRLAWLHLALPQLALDQGLDLLHATNFIAPLLAPCPTVLTIHDLGLFERPEWFHLPRRVYHRALLPLAARRAARIIAVSEATRQQVLAHLKVAPEKVTVVPEATSAAFRPVSEAERARVRARYGLHRPFVLALGSVQPRKNLERLVAAHARAVEGGLEVELVLAGPDAAPPGLEGPGVRALGYVPDGDLPGLYGAAAACAYVSLAEGFGLPALEALACGCPVVVSRAVAEASGVGDAAIVVDPLSVESIAAGLQRALAAGCRPQAARVGRTWDDVAAATAQVYRDALGLSRAPVALPERPEGTSPLGWAVLRTLAYADLFESPLDLAEVHRALHGVKATEAEVAAALASGELGGLVETREGLWFLGGQARHVATRRARERAAEAYLARQGPALSWVSGLPFVRAVALSGGAAHRTSLKRDDLDLFVVCEAKRAWTVAMLSLVTTKLLGLREDVCANYLVDAEHLHIAVQHDVYTAHQLIHLWPVLGERMYARLWSANRWVGEHFPNAAPRALAPEAPWAREPAWKRPVEQALGVLEPGLERLSRAAYTGYLRLRHGPKAGNLWLGPGVLKLHLKDHRQPALERFAARLAGLAAALEGRARTASSV